MPKYIKLIDNDGMQLACAQIPEGVDHSWELQKRIELAEAYNVVNGEGHFEHYEDDELVNKMEIPRM